MKASKSKICRLVAGWRPRGEPVLQLCTKALCWKNNPCTREVNLFILFRTSADQIRPTHIMKNNLFYLKYTNLNINLNQIPPYRSIQNNVWPYIWAPWSSQVNINHTGSKRIKVLTFVRLKIYFLFQDIFYRVNV